MAVMIAFRALFHIAIVTGVFPVSGQPLPLLSKRRHLDPRDRDSLRHYALHQPHSHPPGRQKQDIRDEIEALPEQFGAENRMQL